MEEKITEVSSAAKAAGESFKSHTSSFVSWVKGMLTWENLFKYAGAIILLVAIWFIYKLLIKAVKRIPPEKTTPQRSMILKRFIKYAYYVIVVVYILGLFGVKLSAIWGAAGIAGVAIGFAAQTSVSNLISGLFVLTEGSIHVGDTIIVNGTTGIVDAVNLLSIHVHTFDNQMVRIPNSTVINNSLQNNSYYKIRRITLNVSISYNADMEKALEALSKAPDLCPILLKDPAPAAWFDGFGESGINMTIAAWFNTADFIQAKNELYIAIKKVFDEAEIEIPYNQLDVKIKNS